MDRTVTLRELIAAVAEFAHSENEVIATVVHMVNSGRVRLRGDLAGAHIEVSPRFALSRAAASV
ncbi:MAG TPA: hypothetical protein VFD92_27305 [Candidatus Binatia bacterium]|nr:hypothetical protein [Candidatus Binatia bacterium]